MPVAMKKPHTELQVNMGGHLYLFKNVPASKLKPIISSLDEYKDEAIDWREVARDRIKSSGGETAHMVRSARRAAGLTQVELAKKLGMPQANLSQVETGNRSVGKALAKKMAKVFDLDYRVFL